MLISVRPKSSLRLSAEYRRNNGYSLIELVATIVLTAIVMTLLYTAFSQTQLQSTSPVSQVKAAELAQAYMEEILLKRFDENSPAGNAARCNAPANPACSAGTGADGETRSQFDDVDDYNGLSDNPPQDAEGNNRSGFNNYSVSIAVTYAGTDLGLANTDLKRIDVTVTTPQSENFLFTAYKGNF